jgi:hypothetical protein
MSVVQACAETEAAIQRARSLFASEPEPPAAAANAADAVQGAAQSTTTAGQATSDMSGAFITTHETFVDESAPKLSAAAQTDIALQAHTTAAATLTQAGARRLDAIGADTRATSKAAATVSTPAGERAILVALRSQLARANDVVTTTKQQAAGLAGQVRALKYPPASSGHGDTQALGFGPGGAPQNPPPEDPPRGKDPRYWIDVTKIRYIPEGQLAPYGFTQIGPNLWYPDPHPGYDYTPPPDPVKYPLDIADIRQVQGNQLFPPGYRQIAPPIGGAPAIGVPDPDGFYQPSPPWTPKEPVDIRDIIQVPPGKLAPWGYVEYFPGWFTPGPELTNPPTIPQPR